MYPLAITFFHCQIDGTRTIICYVGVEYTQLTLFLHHIHCNCMSSQVGKALKLQGGGLN